MKCIVITLLCLLFSVSMSAQTKRGINYQAVILDPKPVDIPGQSLQNQPLSKGKVHLRFEILSSDNQIEYAETHATTTDEYGLVNVVIGGKSNRTSTIARGNGIYSSFDQIKWNTPDKNLRVSASFDGGKTFEEIANQTFDYAPYAHYAGAVDYKNVEGAPTKLSELKNDVGFVGKKGLSSLQADISQLKQGTDLLSKKGAQLQNVLNTLSDIPDATTLVTGLVSTAAQSFAGAKTFTSDITVNGHTIGRGGNAALTSNLAIGTGALGNSLTSGSAGNIAIGANALKRNTTGYNNLVIGRNSMNNNTTGFRNITMGSTSLSSNTSGSYNFGLGTFALSSNKTGNGNIGIGDSALYNNTTGSKNLAIGSKQALGDTAANNQMNIMGAIFGTGLTGNYITPAGKIGINNTTPAEALHVTGNGKFSGSLEWGGSLKPGGYEGTAGQYLYSAGSGTVPVWAPAYNVINPFAIFKDDITNEFSVSKTQSGSLYAALYPSIIPQITLYFPLTTAFPTPPNTLVNLITGFQSGAVYKITLTLLMRQTAGRGLDKNGYIDFDNGDTYSHDCNVYFSLQSNASSTAFTDVTAGQGAVVSCFKPKSVAIGEYVSNSSTEIFAPTTDGATLAAIGFMQTVPGSAIADIRFQIYIEQLK